MRTVHVSGFRGAAISEIMAATAFVRFEDYKTKCQTIIECLRSKSYPAGISESAARKVRFQAKTHAFDANSKCLFLHTSLRHLLAP